MRREAEMWVKQALSDLRKAKNDLTTNDWDSAAFWSQQAAEKALKALLLNAGIPYRGHDLLGIAEVIERELNLKLNEEVKNYLRELTIHYTVSRYPNAANAIPSELYTEEKAKTLVKMAESVVEWVKQNLR